MPLPSLCHSISDIFQNNGEQINVDEHVLMEFPVEMTFHERFGLVLN